MALPPVSATSARRRAARRWAIVSVAALMASWIQWGILFIPGFTQPGILPYGITDSEGWRTFISWMLTSDLILVFLALGASLWALTRLAGTGSGTSTGRRRPLFLKGLLITLVIVATGQLLSQLCVIAFVQGPAV